MHVGLHLALMVMHFQVRDIELSDLCFLYICCIYRTYSSTAYNFNNGGYNGDEDDNDYK